MNPLTFGIALWFLFGFMVAFAIAPRLNHNTPNTPTPNEDDMSHLDDTREFPLRFAFRESLDNLPEEVIDAFCHGYARALLWADAFRYISEDECLDADGEYELVRDENATYAYDSPGKWWEGMGIDFADALYFLSDNYWRLCDLVAIGADWEQHGHDFLLTRNHHGAGFWDRGYPESLSRPLTENSEAFGEHSVLTDDSHRVTTL